MSEPRDQNQASVPSTETAPATGVPARKPAVRKKRLAVVLFGFLLLNAGLTYIGVWGGNVRTVVPGKVYRSSQLTGGTLQTKTAVWAGNDLNSVLKADNIRTVFNLRGGSEKDDWFREEAAVCRQNGVPQITFAFSAVRMPPPAELKKLLEAFDKAQYPVLFHCRGGSDRSGLAGTLYLNIFENVPLDEAQARQLTLRYGHIRWGQAHPMDDFLDLYRKTGNGIPLRDWILNKYPALYETLPEHLKTRGPDTAPTAPPAKKSVRSSYAFLFVA